MHKTCGLQLRQEAGCPRRRYHVSKSPTMSSVEGSGSANSSAHRRTHQPPPAYVMFLGEKRRLRKKTLMLCEKRMMVLGC